MSANYKATPRAILRGVNDQSRGEVPVAPVEIPTHLPHVFSFAEEGPTEAQLVIGSSAVQTYGAKTFDERGDYATHQTPFINLFNGKANAMIFQRLKPEDAAPPATLTLSLEVVEDEIPAYERDSSGQFVLNSEGEKIPTGSTVPGFKARWLTGYSATGEIGQATSTAGDLEGADLAQSTIYPILDLQVSSFGKHGNMKGIRLWAPTLRSTQQANAVAIEDQSAFLYRMQMVRRSDAKSQPNVVETIDGSQYIEFTLKSGTVDRRFDLDLFIGDTLLQSYQDLDAQPAKLGPFGGMHLYEDYLETVLELLYDAEKTHQQDWPTDAAVGKHLFNIVGGQDVAGAPYHSYRLLGTADGGATLWPTSTYYANGGSDGTMTNTTFNALVKNECENYGSLENKHLDTAMFPQSCIWDSGFDIETKYALLNPIGLRKDIAVVLSTQDVSAPQNNDSQESSTATALRARARMYPESEIFGTPVCRAAIVGHSGYLTNSRYRGLVPATYQLASVTAEYMGAGNRQWRAERKMDVYPNNRISVMKDLNLTYKTNAAYDRDWENGLIWIQNFDRRSQFFPAMQTVYDDSTSVLNSLVNMFVIIEAQKVSERVWRQLTGNSDLTVDRFIQRSDELIAEHLDETLFNNRVVVVPRTYITGRDEALGYSWATDIELRMNNMRTVGTYTIVSTRRAEFAE